MFPGRFIGWDNFSVLIDFLCAQEPCENVVTKSVLEFTPQDRATMVLFSMMQSSAATAEGMQHLSLEPCHAGRFWQR